MSHVVTIKTEFRDLAAIKAAAKRLGLEFREGQTTYRWWGNHVGDYPMPEGFTKDDLGKCDHALHNPQKPHGYEVGIVKRGDRYHVIYDFIDHSLSQIMGGPSAHRFTQAYATEKAKLELRRKGLSVSEEVLKDGSIKLNAIAR